jgi:tetratricopeptide (TPR) repeat protein/DNA-binding CsgD family transcriptional regulator
MPPVIQPCEKIWAWIDPITVIFGIFFASSLACLSLNIQSAMRKKLLALLCALLPLTLPAAGGGVADSLGADYAALSDTAKIGYLLKASWQALYTNPAYSLRLVEHGLDVASKTGTDHRSLELRMQKGTIYWAMGDLEAALGTYQAARKEFAVRGDSLGLAKADNNLSLVYFDLSYFELSLAPALRALAYFEARHDSLRLPTIYNNVGNIYNATSDHPQAEAYYRKSLAYAYARKDTQLICMIANNLALVLADLHQHQEAKELFETALDGYRAQGNPTGISNVYVNLATLYLAEERWEEADTMYHAALALAEQVKNNYQISVAELKLAEFNIKTSNYAAAVTHGRRALTVGQQVGGLRALASTHEALAYAFAGLGAYDSAYSHQMEFKRFNDSIFSDAKSRAIAELNLKYESVAKDAEIERLDHDRSVSRLRTVILVVTLALLIISALLIVMRQRAILRREKLLKEKDLAVLAANEARIAAELRAANAETTRLQGENEFKSRELTTLAMNIVRKNELLESLETDLKGLRKNTKDGGDEKLLALSRMLAQTLNSEKDRKEIELFIDAAQQNFFQSLETRFPDLSLKERRLCGMIRQGLSSKEIAAVFNINTSSVEVSRYRIRKKLNLEGSQDLAEFLAEV